MVDQRELTALNPNKTLIVYAGGTLGMAPSDPGDPDSPLVPVEWDQLKRIAPTLEEITVGADVHVMKPIDSSEMQPEGWKEIADAIGERYEEYEGFVVLHGTDTMAYTASALSFLFENLDKPVALTGAQIPIGQPGSDALANLKGALQLAAPSRFNLPAVPEVCLLFGDAVLRGNRARKVSVAGLSAFQSPNSPPLGRVDAGVEIDLQRVRPRANGAFRVGGGFDANVVAFDLFPGIASETVRSILSIPGLRGAVMKTFGAGNAPSSNRFLDEIKRASDRGVSVVNVTQCLEGTVMMGRYETSAELKRIGVINGGDMTPEAALVKLMFLLGQSLGPKEIQEKMERNLQGELTPPQRLC